MLAAVVGVNRTLEFPQDVIKTNTLLTMNTLDWISENPINRLLFASSSETYAGTSDLFGIEIPTPESVPLCIGDVKHPRWTYAVTKLHGGSAFLHSAKTYNYGLRDSEVSEYYRTGHGIWTCNTSYRRKIRERRGSVHVIKLAHSVMWTMLFEAPLEQWRATTRWEISIILEIMMR